MKRRMRYIPADCLEYVRGLLRTYLWEQSEKWIGGGREI